jgi:hypothetical protein
MYTQGAASILDTSRAIADKIAGSHDKDLGDLEQRRLAVLKRNHAQLGSTRQ